MRHIMLVLIAFVAIGGLMPTILAAPATPVLTENPAAMPEPAQTALLTTPTMAAFLNDSWTPSTFVAPLASEAKGTLKSMTRNNTTQNNSTYAIYDFLKDNYTSPAPVSPVYSAVAAGKDRTVAWTGESIYQFLEDGWTPSTPVQTFESNPALKQHQLN